MFGKHTARQKLEGLSTFVRPFTGPDGSIPEDDADTVVASCESDLLSVLWAIQLLFQRRGMRFHGALRRVVRGLRAVG